MCHEHCHYGRRQGGRKPCAPHFEGRHEVRIIESDRARSLQLANALDVEIICGDGTNIDMLENAGVRDADCFIAISGDDANNLVASQLRQ